MDPEAEAARLRQENSTLKHALENYKVLLSTISASSPLCTSPALLHGSLADCTL